MQVLSDHFIKKLLNVIDIALRAGHVPLLLSLLDFFLGLLNLVLSVVESGKQLLQLSPFGQIFTIVRLVLLVIKVSK